MGMQQSIFNTRVPLADDHVFLMNTFNDAQLLVTADVVALLDRLGEPSESAAHGDTHAPGAHFSPDELVVLRELHEHGFVVDTRESERAALDTFFVEHQNNSDELHVTVLTTLQCNFACDYCLQGDHDEYNKSVTKMSLDTAYGVCDWLVERLDTVTPRKLALTFFGGEPLLNLEVLYAVSDRAHAAAQQRGVEIEINLITNGILLTPEIVDRLRPLGLKGVKVTLDGDRETHDRMRPLRGGQATFDKIIENIRQVAGRCNIAIGGNFDEESVDSYPAQPTSEAFALAEQLQQELMIIIALALVATITLGYYWGQSFIKPILALKRGTEAIAAGRLSDRVAIAGHDEFHQLGEAFNGMADKLIELKENVRKQERQAMFGRIAAGLVHDISHPIQNIANSCRLVLKLREDAEYRETFQRTVDREFSSIKRVLDDLRNLARPMPLEHFPVDVNRTIQDTVESMASLAETGGLTLESELSPHSLFVEGDLFALGRVYRNLIVNAIEATSPGGSITVTTADLDTRARITVSDTGLGISPERLGAIFEDFNTTKRRGLGLGLAISRKIVEQLGGTIAVTSRVGEGTTFVIEFDKTESRPFPKAVAAS